jgi:hypothetical protein
MNHRRRRLSAIGILTIGLLTTGLVMATSIPAWLDDAITKWNAKNPDIQIQFLDIKDEFVWYMLPRTTELGHQEIRERIYGIADDNKYERTAEEELVTTGRPPAPNNPRKTRKCWRRSFTLDIDLGRQRMLSTMVCEGNEHWYAGFRVLQ